MKLTLQRDALLEELTYLSSVIQKKTTNPVLANIFVDVQSLDEVLLTCSDGFSTMKTRLKATADQVGTFCISSLKLLDVVRSLDDGEVFMTTKDNNRVQIKAGKALINVPGIAAHLYPPVKEADPEGSISIPAAVLDNLINRTYFVIPTSITHSKFVLGGANIVLTPNKIAAVTVDGNRLAYAEDVLLENESTASILIPKESLNDVLKLTRKASNESIHLKYDANQLTFMTESQVLTCRRLHGQFPKYEMMFPDKINVEADCNASLLRRSLARASNLTSDEHKGVVLTFKDDEIEIQTQGDYGDITENIYANYKGEPMSIGFNSRYLLDFLRDGVEDEHDRVIFKIVSPGRAVELNSSSIESYRYIVVPRILRGTNQSAGDQEAAGE